MNNELIVTSQHRNRTKEHLKTALIQLIKKKDSMVFLSKTSLIRRVIIAARFIYTIRINIFSPKSC